MRIFNWLVATLVAASMFCTASLPALAADIVDTAAEAGSFETLVTAVKAAELVDVLKGEGPYTVFAPTDEAFAKLPDGTVEALLQPENREKLVDILTYHVVRGNVTSDQIADGPIETLEGDTVSVTTEGGVMVNGAEVVKADVSADNGVIHVVDTVLLP